MGGASAGVNNQTKKKRCSTLLEWIYDLKQPSFVNLKHAKPVQDLENLMLVDELVIFSLWLNPIPNRIHPDTAVNRDSIKSIWIPALSLSRPSLLHGRLSATLQNSLSIAIRKFDYLSPT